MRRMLYDITYIAHYFSSRFLLAVGSLLACVLFVAPFNCDRDSVSCLAWYGKKKKKAPPGVGKEIKSYDSTKRNLPANQATFSKL